MTTWTAEELDQIGAAEELEIAPLRADGSRRNPVPIWVVRVGDELYIRSYKGRAGAWYRAAESSRAAHIRAGGVETEVTLAAGDPARNAQIDAAYRAKYARYPEYVPPMLTTEVQGTTLKLEPR